MARSALLTYDDLAAMMPADRLRRELIGGELLVSPSPFTGHQDLVLRVAMALVQYAKRCGGRAFVAPLDVILTPHDVVEPDVIFVAADQVAIITERAIEGVPRFIVEVLSPSMRSVDSAGGKKHRLYAEHGVAEYWTIDPATRAIEAFTEPDEATKTYGRSTSVIGRMEATVLPGFLFEL